MIDQPPTVRPDGLFMERFPAAMIVNKLCSYFVKRWVEIGYERLFAYRG